MIILGGKELGILSQAKGVVGSRQGKVEMTVTLTPLTLVTPTIQPLLPLPLQHLSQCQTRFVMS